MVIIQNTTNKNVHTCKSHKIFQSLHNIHAQPLHLPDITMN